MAASMAALIFVSGARREMLPHSRIMIHDPLIGGGIGGSALSVKARADDLMRIRDITGEVLSRHTGMPLDRVSNSRRKTPISRPKMPSRRVLPTP